MSSAVEAREAFSKLEHSVRVMAYGHNGKVVVYFSDKKAMDKEGQKAAEDNLRSSPSGLRIRKLKRA